MARRPVEVGRYGVGEWYGKLVAGLDAATLTKFAHENFPEGRPLCPFLQAAYPGQICNKAGGVCTIRQHRYHTDNSVTVAGSRLITICPNRFWDQNKIFGWIGQELLGTATPDLIKEIPFLDSTLDDADRSVGRIDMVLMDPADDDNWCALELQAVYFSGPRMSDHTDQYRVSRNGLVYPEGIRRPDWRSSGPKRLMPQLQIKVPSLRRWGKKTAVVIDASFRAALGRLPTANDNSNADIIWFIVDYHPDTGEMFLAETLPVTLEDSVIALTAGEPKSLDDFQNELLRRRRNAKRMKPEAE
ncbi:hypothetical protein EN866_19435 [Mesorhizobium sp. M2D.F.Ca.ET.223.01.1.1]|uniref:NotI family restriction endonuclease n=2 Tax=Mesorhizobium TaxID=68287 RepID=UPI000FCC2C6B|nr:MULTISPECIES: NotI family restriction endonuclease [unclassified Mesorhizobium]TGP89334.1 hypothetical protein EN864_19445 [bacterium M00.F.Ca.ET.221.01.1.1]TGP94707.1 hypothetical protein EN865_15315 [bacterium M00.F.Ca.ET.222.01.1.1]RVD58879.1 hypothetical protein EN783_14680 [Mesorhizobium sp. M2D.F.Ca.ET.140.01.1.1]TGP27908.1 hypothetical protein EN875_033165 [Mesorhizobium sp. M2D.F.Ca.ET.232.01.1.1]TGP75875.1 hypothetical protein EN867_15315 [Mesorhizobium sp. M2D.F.Ca.ET.224.01.1.1]